MDIVIAAEKKSIAKLLGRHIRRDISPEEIDLTENPEETGSFFIGLDFSKYRLTPDGEIFSEELHLLD